MDTEELKSTNFFGDLELPIGYRFRPTNLEILLYYLWAKVLGLPLPSSVILEFDVFQTEPYNLPGNLEEDMYFFGKKKPPSVDSSIVAAGSGYWVPTRNKKQIVDSQTNQIVGTKKTMVFCENINHRVGDIRMRWMMHEISLVGYGTTTTTHPNTQVMEEWVVYRLFQKEIGRRRNCNRVHHSEEEAQ